MRTRPSATPVGVTAIYTIFMLFTGAVVFHVKWHSPFTILHHISAPASIAASNTRVNSCLKHTGPANTRMDICRTRIFWRGYHTRCTWPRDDQIHLVFCWLKYITVLRIFQSRILHIFVAFGLSISAVFLPKACLNLLFCPLICPLNLPETQYFKLIDIMHNKLEGLQLLPDFCHCYDLVSNEALQKRTALRVIFPCHPAARYKSGKPHGLPLCLRTSIWIFSFGRPTTFDPAKYLAKSTIFV